MNERNNDCKAIILKCIDAIDSAEKRKLKDIADEMDSVMVLPDVLHAANLELQINLGKTPGMKQELQKKLLSDYRNAAESLIKETQTIFSNLTLSNNEQ